MLSTICLIFALVLFLIAGVPLAAPSPAPWQFRFIPFGLAFLAASFLAPTLQHALGN